MKKHIITLALCLSLGLSPLCAVESAHKKSVQNVALSKADTEFLFNTQAQNINVVALSDEEMAETEGEAIDPISAIQIAYTAYQAYETGKKVVKKIKRWFR
ncbi:hypothetical protein OQH61_08000 [Helicobacter sp. MIT 21-1697]|uniref:hypothetical protein n=1 Tax=Helicobacter sp. MIT 21-1697 TaxID=2993733 RepID=UPI00224AFC5F|nr:hypothetical protein [Helicobacter sp. MIT 21-1697]MCX2717675.1 hypothetical protein [Helicobacter sp. MIT 21-1697]